MPRWSNQFRTAQLVDTAITYRQGYHKGNPSGLPGVDADLVTANIKNGITVFGVAGSATVVDISDADAAVTDVKSPRTFYSGAPPRKDGTMPTVTLAANNPAYPAGYHAGAANLAAIDADLTPANIKTGINIFGYVGTYDTTASAPAAAQVILNKVCWANGAQITGTMLDESAAGITIVPSTIKQNLPDAGYWLTTDASVRVLGSAYLIGANIKSGVTIFGVTGTYDTSASPIAAARMRTNDEGWVNGSKITGSGTQAIASGSNNYVAGYHAGNGGGLSAIEASLATGNIKSGVNIFGFVGVATVQEIGAADAAVTDVKAPRTFFSVTGGIKTGTLATVTLAADNTAYPAGYHAGAVSLAAIDADLAVGNIKSGVNIFGYVGTFSQTATHDIRDQVVNFGNAGTGQTTYFATQSIASGADYDMDSLTQTYAAGSLAEAFGYAYCWSGGNTYHKMRLYMNGVQIAETDYITVNDAGAAAYVLSASSALSGSKIVKISIHNYDASARNFYPSGYSNVGGSPFAAGVFCASVKVV